LELASKSLRAAFEKAFELCIPLVIAGDTLDSKAIMCGKCVNALLDIALNRQFREVTVYILVGNHDLLNEKGKEHTLRFLKPYWRVIEVPAFIDHLNTWLVPYMNDSQELQKFIDGQASGTRIIMHQGVQTAYLGHYVQDKTSLPKEAFADFRVISGHYHRAQDIKCGRPRKGAVGLFSYIGNPYSLSFGEAQDGPKGFQILNDDGLLTPVPTNLRKHVVLNMDVDALHNGSYMGQPIENDDLVWLKISGPYTDLERLNKKQIGMNLLGHTNFKLDKIYTDVAKLEVKTESLTEEQILDKMIDATDEKAPEKKALKSLWREVLS
jgi:DNA repair exonuclease SbcCD nuclease subunit